ncbi:protein phosphatase [Rhodovulum viride]|uniref:Protein phosphatase n=1 Tax=Rhodovulum viride TaxID=1231134 RepID=A0ABX9DF44_9RHOB|nr:protein phosphatase [Rhodovulum viride]RAP40763.1 protein phosphatase [Rhodovulum viride]
MDAPGRHAVPKDVPAAEAREDARPLLIDVLGPVASASAQPGKRVFLGNLAGAEDAAALTAAGVTETLNLGLNLCPGPLALGDGTQVRRYQIGLIDGPGNDPHLLAAAVVTVRGLMGAYGPGKPHYPPHRPGHLLVHCRGGRSRSVTVLAVWLTLCHPQAFPDLDAALAHLRRLRGLDTAHPLPPMLDLAREVIARDLAGRAHGA